MSVKSLVTSRIAAHFTGEDRQRNQRARAERIRRARRQPHRVDYFHQADDPYSHLTAQILQLLVDRYDVDLQCHLVSAPHDWAAPERERLIGYSRADAARLAAKAGLMYADPGQQPSGEQIARAQGTLAAALDGSNFVAQAFPLGNALWSGRMEEVAELDPRPAIARGDQLRAKLGHYLGATFHYGGEWYWGVDRLHHLEERLALLGVRRAGAPPTVIYRQPNTPAGAAPARGGELHFFLSFRSPYTYIATSRIKALADAYGATLRLRFVLPMVMRGLPVPASKRGYITLDAAREARRAGVPFGRIADPVGAPVERGYSLLPWAIAEGRGYEYCFAFMRAVWSQGVDAGANAGLRAIVEAAGLPWSTARRMVGDTTWRAIAEANRQEMLDLGLWGVPCFRFGHVVTWGQDRLWVIEDAMRG